MDINNQITLLKLQNELLKQMGLIEGYKIETETKNYAIADDGALTFDLVVTSKIIPNLSPKEITINIGFTGPLLPPENK